MYFFLVMDMDPQVVQARARTHTRAFWTFQVERYGRCIRLANILDVSLKWTFITIYFTKAKQRMVVCGWVVRSGRKSKE
jgi:hypothetical protein